MIAGAPVVRTGAAERHPATTRPVNAIATARTSCLAGRVCMVILQELFRAHITEKAAYCYGTDRVLSCIIFQLQVTFLHNGRLDVNPGEFKPDSGLISGPGTVG